MPLKPIYPRDKEIGNFRWSSELFNKKIDSTAGVNACHIWTGSRGEQGPLFGVRKIQPDGTDLPQMTQARRILFAENTGTALKPMQGVYHQCGNPNCMNFLHLTLSRPVPVPSLSGRPDTGFKRTGRPRGRPPGSKTRTEPRARPGDAN